MTEPVPMTPEVDEANPEARRKQLMVLGGIGGAVVVLGGAFLLLHGGSSTTDNAVPLPAHRAVVAAPSAAPSATASPEAALPVFHGSVGDRDPFAVPAAILAAQGGGSGAAAPAAAGAATPGITVASASASPSPSASASIAAVTVPVVAPVSIASSGSTSSTTVTPARTTTSASTASATPVMPDQFIQLLAARDTASGWLVDVRTAAGVIHNVKPHTRNVGHTLFYYQGEYLLNGAPAFAFTVGEGESGSMTPNSKESPVKPHASKSCLILHRGIIDGGVYAD